MSLTSRDTKSHLKELDSYYKLEIEPGLKSREQRRVAAIRRRWLIIGVGLAVAAAGVGFLRLNPQLHPAWYLLPAAVAAVAVALGIQTTSQLRSEVKAFLANKLAAFFGFSYEAVPTADLVARFRECGIIPNYDRSGLEDRWSGSANGVAFDMVEAHLEERKTERDSHGHKSTSHETVFRGLLLTLAYPRPFRGSVMLRNDLGRVVNWIRARLTTSESVEFDDQAFEWQYEVFADDVAEARQLLDPMLRQRILKLSEEHRLTLAFDAGDLLLAIESSDRFEPSSFGHTLLDPERVRAMAADVGIVFDIVDRLNLKPNEGAAAGS